MVVAGLARFNDAIAQRKPGGQAGRGIDAAQGAGLAGVARAQSRTRGGADLRGSAQHQARGRLETQRLRRGIDGRSVAAAATGTQAGGPQAQQAHA